MFTLQSNFSQLNFKEPTSRIIEQQHSFYRYVGIIKKICPPLNIMYTRPKEKTVSCPQSHILVKNYNNKFTTGKRLAENAPKFCAFGCFLKTNKNKFSDQSTQLIHEFHFFFLSMSIGLNLRRYFAYFSAPFNSISSGLTPYSYGLKLGAIIPRPVHL